jgi:16S rRNA (guanine966-N2)-methyltransferase
MRITGGSHRSRKLPARVLTGVRPTAARVREALFNILGNDLGTWTVLDATGGSGILALEAASRGALVTIQERSRRLVNALQVTVRELDLQDRVTVRCADSLRPEAGASRFDLVLADPPYAQELEPWIEALAPRVERVLVLEHDAKNDPPSAPEAFELDTRRYGGTKLSFYWRR